jgi:uncharacterized damage-inducible protein DinB
MNADESSEPAGDLRTFYRMVTRTRSGVLGWLEELPLGVYEREHGEFAFGSLRGIFSHVVDCYLLWVATVGLGEARRERVVAADVLALRDAFDEVDAAVSRALDAMMEPDAPFERVAPDGYREILTPRWTILHPVTHEFHHKGQALALARMLGHPHPGEPDTDLLPGTQAPT